MMTERTGISWSTGSHTADTTLLAYANGEMGKQLKVDLAGMWDNTELQWYTQAALGVSLDEVTALLRRMAPTGFREVCRWEM